MSDAYPYGLFERIGVELEYMVVDAETLDVLPVTDRILKAASGSYESEVAVGPVSWSNELCLHVIELKTTEPAPDLAPWGATFQEHVGRINEVLSTAEHVGDRAGRLLPTGMHPWMDPWTQMRLWPHEHSQFYERFHGIFDCRGHGWANLQSVHVNLPFRDDETEDGEFGRLHAAIRLLLPIMPALSASSPVMDSRVTGVLDSRLQVYKTNARRVPSVSGRVIPEAVYTREAYERVILQRIYDDLAPLDPEGVLRHEWANARGAIARFERGSIEIRVLDVQECPAADVAIVRAITGALGEIVTERWADLPRQQRWDVEPLAALLDRVILEGERTVIDDRAYLEALGWGGGRASAGDLWRHLLEASGVGGLGANEPLGVILSEGTLARRILNAVGEHPDQVRLGAVYGALADCLRDGKVFRAPG